MNAPSMPRRAFLGYGAALSGLAALALTGCGPNAPSSSGAGGAATPAGNVNLQMSAFGSNSRQQKLQKVYDLYQKKNGGQIGLEILSNDAYAQKLSTEVAGGAAADVIALFQNIVAQYAQKGTLLALDSYNILDVSKFDKSSIASGVIDGKRVALPLGDNAYGVIYDKGALDAIGMKVPEPGHTWDDFIKFANDVKTKKGSGYFGTIDDSGDYNGFEIFLRQRGKQLYQNGKLGFSKDDMEAWFQIWADLRKSGAAPPGDLTVQTTTGGFGNSLLVQGKAPNFFIYPNVLSSFASLTKSELAVTTMPMPSASKSGHFIRASNWVSVYGKSEHPADAVNLLNFMLNDKDAATVLAAEFGAPPNTELRKSITYTAVDQKFIDYVNLVAKSYSQPVPSLAEEFPNGSPQVQTTFVTISQSIATGKETVSSGTDKFLSQAAGFLK